MTAARASDGRPGGREQQDRARQDDRALQDDRVSWDDQRHQGDLTSRGGRAGQKHQGSRTSRVGQTSRGDAGAGATGLSTLTRLAFLGGPMLSMIDSSVVNIAVPDIVADLRTSLATAAWTVSGYLLGLAAGLAATPWLARRFGTLPAYQAALAGFIATSACCAFAPTVGVLTATRVLQGLPCGLSPCLGQAPWALPPVRSPCDDG